LKEHLASDGSVLLAGEPIVKQEDLAVPYAWGLRLHSEVVAVIRLRRWFELGFTEDFLVNLFVNAGFAATPMECAESIYGGGYVFRHRDTVVPLGKCWFPVREGATWYGAEGHGRWSKEESRISLDITPSFNRLIIEATNYHPVEQLVLFSYGLSNERVAFSPGETKSVSLSARARAPLLRIKSEARAVANSLKTSIDPRSLGIFVHEIRYV
jgi:hypothetical protein